MEKEIRSAYESGFEEVKKILLEMISDYEKAHKAKLHKLTQYVNCDNISFSNVLEDEGSEIFSEEFNWLIEKVTSSVNK